MTSDSELIEFIQARMNGERVEQKCGSIWLDFENWDSNAVYRVKPDPIMRWVNVYPDGTYGDFAYLSPSSAKEGTPEGTRQIKMMGVNNDK